jgi:hypothetical protein
MKTRNILAAAAALAATVTLAAGTASASPAPVTRVTGLHVTAATTTTLTVTWNKPAAGEAVRIQVYDADTLKDTFDTAHSAAGDLFGTTTVTAKGLAAGTAYVLRADAYNGSANTGWTAPVTVYTQASGAAGTAGPAGPKGDTGPAGAAGPSGLAGAYYAVAKYDTGDTNGGAIATVACKNTTDVAIAGGVQTLALGTNGIGGNVPVASSFPGRMDWAANTPVAGRLDGWIVQFGGNSSATDLGSPKYVTVYALCVPGASIPVDVTYTESGS